MRTITKLYLALGILGAALAALAMILEGTVSKPVGGMLMGIGAGLFAFGFSMWRARRQEEKDPRQMRQNRIETTDERNVAIRNRAKAHSGEVLQWAVLAAAWISIGFGAPLWVTLLAVGVFLLKSLLELCLIAKYQREM